MKADIRSEILSLFVRIVVVPTVILLRKGSSYKKRKFTVAAECNATIKTAYSDLIIGSPVYSQDVIYIKKA